MNTSSRRSFLKYLASAAALSSASAALADAGKRDGKPSLASALESRNPPDLSVMDLTVEGDKRLGNRFTLFCPNHLAKDERVPLLVLFHGLGETWDPTVGVFAWVERYGLGTAYARLRRPPVTRSSQQTRLVSDARLAELNASLSDKPFRGLAIACPYTPNIGKLPDPARAFDDYAAWITERVIPRARKEAPVFPDAGRTFVDGVSLGGYVGMEVFLRRSELFGAWGGVQSAFNAVRIPYYADKLAAARMLSLKSGRSGLGIHIETSLQDPMREVNAALSHELTRRGVPHDFWVLPGQHDQVFLREVGTLQMLLFYDRRPR